MNPLSTYSLWLQQTHMLNPLQSDALPGGASWPKGVAENQQELIIFY